MNNKDRNVNFKVFFKISIVGQNRGLSRLIARRGDLQDIYTTSRGKGGEAPDIAL